MGRVCYDFSVETRAVPWHAPQKRRKSFMNSSKKTDSRCWAKWARSGAISSVDYAIVSQTERVVFVRPRRRLACAEVLAALSRSGYRLMTPDVMSGLKAVIARLPDCAPEPGPRSWQKRPMLERGGEVTPTVYRRGDGSTFVQYLDWDTERRRWSWDRQDVDFGVPSTFSR